MTSQIDCPICMDCIESTNNCVTTECGHCFHSNCLMKSIAHNGFRCPYCRTIMAEVPEDKESDYDEYSYDSDVLSEYTLTSFRMFHQRINGEEVEEVEEDEEDEEDDEEDLVPRPDATYLAQKLNERGVTIEDLIKYILVESDFGFRVNHNINYTDYESRSNEIYGQFRSIFNRYYR